MLPPRFPGTETTRPPKGGLSEPIQILENFGAGEGARTLDPDLGKVVPSRCADMLPFPPLTKIPINPVDLACSVLFSFARICVMLLAIC